MLGKECEATDKKYQLLYYFFVERNSIDDLERWSRELGIVQSGEQTFEELFEEKYGTIAVGYSSGEFECDKDKAYFISNNEKSHASFDMPLQELIDLLNEWKTFLES